MKRIVLFLLLLMVCRFCTFAFAIRYWIDKDLNNIQTISNLSTFSDLSLPLPNINEGYHLLIFQLSEDETVWSTPYSIYFTKYNKELTNFSYILNNNINSSKFNLIESSIDVSDLNIGMHNITIFSTEPFSPPVSSLFYKRPAMMDIKLELFDATKSLISSTKLNAQSKDFVVNISDLKTGYNPISIICMNNQNELLYTGAHLINKIPNGGHGVKRLDYVIDTDIEHQKHLFFNASKPNFSFESLLDISDFNYSPNDTYLFIDNHIPYIAPKTSLHLFALDAKGFLLDSIVPFTDKYRKERLDAPVLNHNKQYDFINEFTQPAWLSFNADSCDIVNFRVRRDCDVSLFSPDTHPLHFTSLSSDNDNIDYSLAQKGRYFLKISNIKPSRQTFSVKVKFLNNNHYENIDSIDQSFPEFDGTLISWKDQGDWVESDTLLEFSSENIMISSHKSEILRPRFSSLSDLVIPLESSFCLKFNKFVTKIVFVPSSPNLVNHTSLLPSNGNIEIDSISNVVIWTGFNDKIDFTVINPTDSTIDFSKFYFRKMYVTFSNVDSDSRLPIISPFDSFDGSSYTHLYVWYDGISKDCYKIEGIERIGFTEDSLIIIRKSEDEVKYPRSRNYIFTFEYNIGSNGESIKNDLSIDPLISINNDRIYITDLPNHVSICDIKGIEYFSSYISDSNFSIPIEKLGKGIYIIRVGKRSVKIIL